MSTNHVHRLQRTLQLIDSILDSRPSSPAPPKPPLPAMAARRLPVSSTDNTCSGSEGCLLRSNPPSDTNSLTCLMDFDGHRPKSFLHDEMDEFNQIFSELARSKNSKLRYMLDDIPDGNETPIARLSPGPAAAETVSNRTANFSHAETMMPSEFYFNDEHVDNGLFIAEDMGAAAGGCCALDSPPMRRSHSVAETGAKFLADYDDSRPYGSLTSAFRVRSGRRKDSPAARNLASCRTLMDSVDQAAITDTVSNLPTLSMEEDDADSGYQSGNNTLVSAAAVSHTADCVQPVSPSCDLLRRINCFNTNKHGLTMSTEPDTDVFQGFIRVHMNLHKPINMALSTCPASVYDILPGGSGTAAGSGVEAASNNSTEISSFYLPNNTVKVIHINSEMTTPMVIQTLLNKFMITDSCNKFALYEKLSANGAHVDSRLSEMMRRLDDDERPLELCLRWSDEGVDSLDRHEFILQDNVTAEIMWDAFSLPELEAFLRILEREEESYMSELRLKYNARRITFERRLRELDQTKQSTSVK